MKYGNDKHICANCQFWAGSRKVSAFTVEVEESLATCTVRSKNGPRKPAQHPDCPDFKKWDQIKR